MQSEVPHIFIEERWKNPLKAPAKLFASITKLVLNGTFFTNCQFNSLILISLTWMLARKSLNLTAAVFKIK